MMRTKGPVSLQQLVAAATLALAGASLPVRAQDAGSYQLPPSPTPSATAQGPVVPDAPPPRVAATQSAAPPPAPAPSISVAPVTVPSPRPASRPSPSAAAAVPTQRASAAATEPTPPPAATASPAASATSATPALPTIAPAPALVPDGSTLPEAQATAETEDGGVHPVVWLALALAILTALVAALALHRRRQEEREPEFQPPVVRAPSPARPEPVSKPASPSRPPARAAALTLDLDAARMSASLVNATLAYRITLIANADIDDIVVRGDMTSAHASRPAEEQFSLDQAPVLHRLARIETGTSTELRGEIRLPLAAITPIRHGSTAMFVPLVRIEVSGLSSDGPVQVRAAFVIGLDEQGAARLQPFRLDQGPRVYQQVGKRALAVPAFG